jgi:hypothetical protein
VERRHRFWEPSVTPSFYELSQGFGQSHASPRVWFWRAAFLPILSGP